MKSQLYVHDGIRERLKNQLQSFTDFFVKRVSPLFKDEDIEAEAKKYEEDLYKEYMSSVTEDNYNGIDESAIAEAIDEERLEHYKFLSLGKYNLIASWHASLYQLFEQQLRLFLFKKVSHVKKLEFRTFCDHLDKIKKP